MNILITGSDGFIGSELKKYLIKKGHQVSGTVFLKNPGEDEVHIDITDPEDINKLPDFRFDAVIHTIGEVNQTASYREMYKITVDGTRLITEAAKKNGWLHIIHISSVAVYGFKTMGENRTEDLTKRSDIPFGIPYMRTKAKAEKVVEESGLDYTILRLPAIIGRNDNSLSPAVIPALVDGSFFLCGKKDRKVSLLNVKNIGPVIEKIVEAGPLNDAFNCCDFHVPFCSLVKEYSGRLGVSPKPGKKSILSLPFNLKDKSFLLILTFSRFGAHYPDKKLHERVPHSHPHSWKEGVRDAVESYLGNLDPDARNVFTKCKH
jgi:nucleoside-diphosphate-sugar epimerase